MVSLRLVTAYLLPFAAVLTSVSAVDSSPEDWDNCDEIPTISTTASPTADPTTTSASPTSTSVAFSGPGYLKGYYDGIQKGCLITAGTWYAGVCAKITAIPLDDGFTISTSKGPCAVTDSVLNCAAGTTPSVFNQIDGLLAYGGSSAWYVPAVPNPAQIVSQIPGPVAVTFQWLGHTRSSQDTNMPPKIAQSPGNKQKSDDERFSDASSSYWPEGWSWARYSDPDVDFSTLSEEEKEKMRNGLQEVLGDDGTRKMSLYLRQKMREWEDKKLQEQGAPSPGYNAPDFLKQWERRHRDGPWGFIAFRTALYDDEEKWTEFKSRVRRILHVAFDQVVEQHRGHEYEDVAKARKSFELHWIEDKDLDGASAETLRRWYVEVKNKEETPVGMDYNMFLCASPEAVESVLSLDEDNLPTTKSSFWRDEAPFLLVVMEEAEVNPHGDEEHDPNDPNDERNWYKSVFKVPVEIIPDNLWDLVDRAFMQPTRLTRGVKGSIVLGGSMSVNYTVDGLAELWWGMAPTPQALKRRCVLKGL
ncbi:hypothetical protein V492_04424 [Pseudogymnoascus sp. VKM F-4246]|nr:hypothetical protein V492_04424 [Pseudogymnoascus sp. VKM F-4246]